MTLALGLGLAPRASFLALNRGLGQEAEALAPGAAQERGPLKALDEGRSRGSGRLAKVLGEEHLVKRFNDLNGKSEIICGTIKCEAKSIAIYILLGIGLL